MLFNLRHRLKPTDDPYPFRVFDNIIDPELWSELANRFPPDDVLVPMESVGHKAHLAADVEPKEFQAFLAKEPLWAKFVADVYDGFDVACGLVFPELVLRKKAIRFEFSGLYPDGGGIYPHPDTPKKLVTLVLYFNEDWDNEWGGQFEVLRHKERPNDDFSNKRTSWDEVETVFAVPVVPNRGVFMYRTNNSLHGVRPIQSAEFTRRTITVNLVGKAAR